MAKRFTSTPDVPRIEKGVTLFRSCLVSAEYPGVEASTKWLFERFGIEYTVNEDQTCCTGLGYYSDLMPIQTTVGIAARNACVVVDDEHPVMSYLCSTCYAINKKARNILDVPELPRRDQRGARQDRPRVRRPRRRHRAAQAHPRDPVGRPRQRPGARSAAVSTASRWPPTPPATTARSSRTRPWATTRTSWCRRRC